MISARFPCPRKQEPYCCWATKTIQSFISALFNLCIKGQSLLSLHPLDLLYVHIASGLHKLEVTLSFPQCPSDDTVSAIQRQEMWVPGGTDRWAHVGGWLSPYGSHWKIDPYWLWIFGFQQVKQKTNKGSIGPTKSNVKQRGDICVGTNFVSSSCCMCFLIITLVLPSVMWGLHNKPQANYDAYISLNFDRHLES